MSKGKQTYNPCDDCQYSYSKNNQESGMCKICEFTYFRDRKQSEGCWKEHVRVSKEGKPLLRHYQCNLCGVYLATQANFCPNCGAKMKGGEE